MKTSNKIVWGSLTGLLGITTVFLIVLKVLLSPNLEATDVADKKEVYASREIAMAGFTGIDLDGLWHAEILQGPKEQIVVEGPEDLLKTLLADQRGEFLVLKMIRQGKDARKLNVAITTPFLYRLVAKGVSDITLSRLQSERIFIRTEGVVSLVGEKGQIGDLRLRAKGVSRMNLGDISIRNAELDCKGVININLTLNGGELTGSLKGVGELRYAGEISRESIRIKGPCKITRETRS